MNALIHTISQRGPTEILHHDEDGRSVWHCAMSMSWCEKETTPFANLTSTTAVGSNVGDEQPTAAINGGHLCTTLHGSSTMSSDGSLYDLWPES